MSRGFYSVVQYCPDRFRAEAVNVGLVLLCPDPHTVRVRMTDNHKRVRKLFAVSGPELKNLKFAVNGFVSRVENSVGELRTMEDLAEFAASRANDFRLTEPRLAKVQNIEDDFNRLFSELVEARTMMMMAAAPLAEVLPPKLAEVFRQLEQARKIWRPGTIKVPVYKHKLDIPYAYRNGVVNLVKPKVFSATKRMENEAAVLAINGDLIQRHFIDREQQKLIVISTQETTEQASEINKHVEPLFKEYSVRLIRPNDVDAFALEVEESAH